MLPPDGTRAWSVETRTPLEMRAETRTTHEMMRVTWSACVREVASSRAAGGNARVRAFPGSARRSVAVPCYPATPHGLDGDKLDKMILISRFRLTRHTGEFKKADIWYRKPRYFRPRQGLNDVPFQRPRALFLPSGYVHCSVRSAPPLVGSTTDACCRDIAHLADATPARARSPRDARARTPRVRRSSRVTARPRPRARLAPRRAPGIREETRSTPRIAQNLP